MHAQAVIDAATVVVSTLLITISSHLTLSMASVDQFDELSALLVPLIGATFASGGMILLNPQPETRNQVIGRSIIGLLFGICSPSLLCMSWDRVHFICDHPVVQIPVAAFFTMLCFALSKPLVNRLISRSDSAAEKIVKALEDKIP